MNNQRRKAIAAQQDVIAQAIGVLDAAKSEIESLRDEEQEYFDNMPESFQEGDKGEAATAAVEAMDEAIEALDAFIASNIEDALSTAAE